MSFNIIVSLAAREETLTALNYYEDIREGLGEDLEDRYGGDYDDHLTEHGKEQAEKLAQKLKHSGIELKKTT